MPDETPSPAFGLLAGWGRYPIVVAHALKQQGYRVCCIGLKGHADPSLRDICDVYVEKGVGKLGAGIRFFRRCGAARATMAGKIHKTILFKRFGWVRHFPDLRTCLTFYPHFLTRSQDRKDDTLLGAVTDAFARGGITFAPATDFAPELLVKPGFLGGRRPSSAEWQDIAFGWSAAKELGRLDIGQSVAVKGRAVLAVEAVEGTDECIRRAGALCPQGGFTVVKVAKPQQDMRFDVPTIGIGTIESLVAASARVLAIEAEKTIIIDELQVGELAQQHGICVAALSEQELAERGIAA